MKLMIDLNVIMDIITGREEFANNSIEVCNLDAHKYFLSAHMVTTASYLSRKLSRERAEQALDLILGDDFSIVPCDRKILLAARKFGFADFEDAVVAASAEKARCQYIITRNPRDFAGSPVPALTPAEFLTL